MVQMSQVLEYADKTSHPQTRHLAEAISNRTLQAMPLLRLRRWITDGECLEGRCPRREPRTTWRAKPLFDRRLECVDERAAPSAMGGVLYTTRRSEAKPR